MKTKIIKSIGILKIERQEYFLIRIEKSYGFELGVHVFTVMDCAPDAYDFDNDGKPVYREPYLLTTTAGWIAEYHFPLDLRVIDTPKNTESEVDEYIPTPADITDAEWERMLNDVDTQSNTQENVE